MQTTSQLLLAGKVYVVQSPTMHQQHNIRTFHPLLINHFNLVSNPSKHWCVVLLSQS